MVSFHKHKTICVIKQWQDCQNFISSNTFLLNAAELLCMEHVNTLVVSVMKAGVSSG